MIEPPIHAEYFLSGRAITLTFMLEGANAVISFCILSDKPGYIELPPHLFRPPVLAFNTYGTGMPQ